MGLTIYNKKPLTIKQQIEKLDSRGLKFDDKELAANYLSNISYYRLRAYTYPFQDNTDPDNDHKFIREGITFNDIIQLYCFDRRLRSLVFNALEKIEVAVRTKIIYTYSIATGDSHWYVYESAYNNITKFEKFLSSQLRVISKTLFYFKNVADCFQSHRKYTTFFLIHKAFCYVF